MADIKQSFNQVDIEREDEFIHTILRFYKIQQNICLPAIVRKVYPEKHTVDAELLCSYVTTDGKEIKRALLSEIPWKQMRHGGFFIDFPISVGDTGWVVAGDRDSEKIRESNSDTDISKNKGSTMPETNGIDEFQYGVFIPDSWAKPFKNAENNLVIGKIDSNGKEKGFIEITSDGLLKVTKNSKTISIDTEAVLEKVVANFRYDITSHQLQWDEFTIRGIDYEKTGSMNIQAVEES